MKSTFLLALSAGCLSFALANTEAQAQIQEQVHSTPNGVDSFPAYRINPGDELEVSVWGEERLQREIKVLPDGTFSFPLAGIIAAGGSTPAEVQALIAQRLQGQFRGDVPQVTVAVRNPVGLQFSVVGRVRTPGTFTPGRYVDVLEALSFAGGPTEFANLRNVIIRRGSGGVAPIRVRLTEWFKGNRNGRGGELPQLQGGDTVVVP